MKIITLKEIKTILKSIDIISPIEKGFIAYSQGKGIFPKPGELIFENPPGDMHIKYGYLLEDDYYLIKIASGFYDNFKLNLPSSNGLMLLFNKKTGELETIFLDAGYLTDLRTAVAGAIAAKYLAPRSVNKIGIVGTGTQAKLQLQFLKGVLTCREVIAFGRNHDRLMQFQTEMKQQGFKVHIAKNSEDLTSNCNLIVTTTASTSPLLFAHQIKKGTHITAIGADAPHKQELDESIFGIADIVCVDSISQCMERGDSSYAIHKKIIHPIQISELGNIISGVCESRSNDNQITIADLTGLVVQDIQIAKAIYTFM